MAARWLLDGWVGFEMGLDVAGDNNRIQILEAISFFVTPTEESIDCLSICHSFVTLCSSIQRRCRHIRTIEPIIFAQYLLCLIKTPELAYPNTLLP